MPRGFNPNQMRAIRQKLIEYALLKISETGIRKTSVENLARAANISAGAFYKFYPSKEVLFFEVYEILESRLKEEFIALLQPVHDGDLRALKQAVQTLFSSENMQRLLTLIGREELDYLVMNMDAEIIRQHQQADRAYMEEVLEHLRRCGIQPRVDAELLVSYAQALFILSYEKDQLAPHAGRIFGSFIDAMLADLTGNGALGS